MISVDDIERRAGNSNDSADLKSQYGSGGCSSHSPVLPQTIDDWMLSIAKAVCICLERVAQLEEYALHTAILGSVVSMPRKVAGSSPAPLILKPTTRFWLRPPSVALVLDGLWLKVRALVRQWTRMEAWELRQALWKPVKYPLFHVGYQRRQEPCTRPRLAY